MMQKILLKLFILFIVSISVVSEPYKPYPVIFVHGLGSNSGAWGAPTLLKNDSIPKDLVESEHTYDQFLNYMNPYGILWDGIDDTYTKPADDDYPNKTFLEVINFNDNRGSIDPHPGYPNFNGQGDELWHRINEVMYEYYGAGWQKNRNAKIILVGYSIGGLARIQATILFPFFYWHLV